MGKKLSRRAFAKVAGAAALAALAALCLFRLKLGVLRTLGITAAAGLPVKLLTGL